MLSLSQLIMGGFWLHGRHVEKSPRKVKNNSKRQLYICSVQDLSNCIKIFAYIFPPLPCCICLPYLATMRPPPSLIPIQRTSSSTQTSLQIQPLKSCLKPSMWNILHMHLSYLPIQLKFLSRLISLLISISLLFLWFSEMSL